MSWTWLDDGASDLVVRRPRASEPTHRSGRGHHRSPAPVSSIHLTTETEHPPPTPWPVADPTAPCLLFGGTFDPPHGAHIALAAAARDAALGSDAWLVFVPAGQNPCKPTGPIASDAQRIEMLRLATAELERSAIWTDEVDRAAIEDGPSYWSLTLDRARIAAPRATDLRFLIGADQAVAFHRWRDPDEIVRVAEPVVLLRAPHDTRKKLAAALRGEGRNESEIRAWMDRVADVGVAEASSTAVRGGDRTSLNPRVAQYIRRHGLYT